MFGIGGFELFLIVLFGFLVFGPDKLPEIAKTVGRAIAKFRDAQNEMSATLKDVAFDKSSDTPFKNPFDAADKAVDSAKRGAATAKSAAASVRKAATESAATATASSAPTRAEGAAESSQPVRESFAERKARYERERVAKAKREAEAAGADAAVDEEGGA